VIRPTLERGLPRKLEELVGQQRSRREDRQAGVREPEARPAARKGLPSASSSSMLARPKCSTVSLPAMEIDVP
jgi:hypothetical protein